MNHITKTQGTLVPILTIIAAVRYILDYAIAQFESP